MLKQKGLSESKRRQNFICVYIFIIFHKRPWSLTKHTNAKTTVNNAYNLLQSRLLHVYMLIQHKEACVCLGHDLNPNTLIQPIIVSLIKKDTPRPSTNTHQCFLHLLSAAGDLQHHSKRKIIYVNVSVPSLLDVMQ